MGRILRLPLPAALLAAIMILAANQGVTAQVSSLSWQSAQTCTSAALNGVAPAGTQVACSVQAPNTLGASAIIMAAPSLNVPTSALQCRGFDGSGYTTQALTSGTLQNQNAGYGSAGACVFQVTSGTVPNNSPLGIETITLLGPVTGGTFQLSVAYCTDLTCGAGSSTNTAAYGVAGTYSCASAGCGSVLYTPSTPQYSASTASTPICGASGCSTVLVPPSAPQGSYAATSCYAPSCSTVLAPSSQPQSYTGVPGGLSCTPFGSGYYSHQ